MCKIQRWLPVLCLLAFAQTIYALEAQPSYQTLTLKRGERVTKEIHLFNNEDVDFNVTPGVKDWFISQANKNIKTSDWLSVNTKTFLLKKGERKTIKFTAEAPKKAQGEVMGMLTFGSKPITGGMITFRFSSAIYVAIKGDQKFAGEVAAIAINTSSDTTISYLFVNRGNVHLRPFGWMRIYDDKNQLLLNVHYPSGLPTYPGTRQAYSQTIKNIALPIGKYRAEMEFQDADWGTTYPLEKKKFEFNGNGKLTGVKEAK
jgi:hypothetical protein